MELKIHVVLFDGIMTASEAADNITKALLSQVASPFAAFHLGDAGVVKDEEGVIHGRWLVEMTP